MINLLPPERSKQLNAARQNTLLLRYVIGTLIVLGLVVAVHIAAFALLKTSEMSNITTYEANEEEISNLQAIRDQSEEYAKNLQTAKAIFDSKIPYADASVALAKQLPEGTIIQSIALSPDLIGEPTTLTASAASYEAGLLLRDRLDSSEIAENVSIASINDGRAPGSEDGGYPFTIILNLTYTDALLQPRGNVE